MGGLFLLGHHDGLKQILGNSRKKPCWRPPVDGFVECRAGGQTVVVGSGQQTLWSGRRRRRRASDWLIQCHGEVQTREPAEPWFRTGRDGTQAVTDGCSPRLGGGRRRAEGGIVDHGSLRDVWCWTGPFLAARARKNGRGQAGRAGGQPPPRPYRPSCRPYVSGAFCSFSGRCLVVRRTTRARLELHQILLRTAR